MKPTGFNNLSAEDAAVILELSPILNITFAERLVKALTDRKFYVETAQGEKRLLRICTTEHYDWLESDARAYDYMAASGINVMRLIGMDIFHEGTLAYQLFTWFDGEDLAEVLPRMNYAEQYSAGIKSGSVLRKLHALSPMYDDEPWGVRFRRRVQEKIQSYNDKLIKSREVDLLLRYLQDNMELLDNRPQTFTHGDWNAGNMMFCPDGQIGVIDFGSAQSRDPWFEFREMSCYPDSSPHFHTGHINGYFEDEPPIEFFRMFAYYMAFATFEGMCGDSIGEDVIEYIKNLLNWFDDMRNPVPTWYLDICSATLS